MGNEKIVGLNARVRDFWQFALSDLRMNNTQGHLDEFIVARALKLADARREWDAYDLLYGGITFEIKSSEYLQSWEQRNVSKIQLTLSRARLVRIVTRFPDGTPCRCSCRRRVMAGLQFPQRVSGVDADTKAT